MQAGGVAVRQSPRPPMSRRAVPRHRFRPVDFVVPTVASVVMMCLAVFWGLT